MSNWTLDAISCTFHLFIFIYCIFNINRILYVHLVYINIYIDHVERKVPEYENHKLRERKVKTLTRNWRDHKRIATHKHTETVSRYFDWQAVFLNRKSFHVPIVLWSLQFLVRVFTFLSLNLWFSYFGTFLSTWSISEFMYVYICYHNTLPIPHLILVDDIKTSFKTECLNGFVYHLWPKNKQEN